MASSEVEQGAAATANESAQRSEPTKFAVGDTVKVHQKIREADKERIQVFAGTVIARKGRGISSTFTVRRVSHGVGVEKVFPVQSPNLARIEVTRSSHVRRSKLYFLRDLGGRQARLKEKLQA